MITTTIGLLAAFSTTMAFLPQVVKIWRTKSVEDLSFGMFGLFTLGIILWLTYGILINDLPVIVANSVSIVFQAAILTQIVRYRRPKNRSPENH